MSRYLWISICFGLPLFLLAGCLGQKQVDRSPDLSHLLTPEEAAAAKAKKAEEEKNALALLNSIRDLRSSKGGSMAPVDCETLCPPKPAELCPEATPTPSSDASSTTALVIAPPLCAPQILAKKLEDLLNPPAAPSSVHVFQDHAGNLIFSMLSAADVFGNKYIHYAVLTANGTVLDWLSLGSGNIDEYAISTSAINNKLHVVARVGTDLKHCVFEVGQQCSATDWHPIAFNQVEIGTQTVQVQIDTVCIPRLFGSGCINTAVYGPQVQSVRGARNTLTAIKEGSLNLFEVPDVGVGLGLLGIPHTLGAANPPSTDGGYWFLETLYAERDSPPQWQSLLNGYYGQVFTQDLKMTYFPVKWDVGEGLDNDLASSSVFVTVHKTLGRMHYDWNRSWLFTSYDFDADGEDGAERYNVWRTTYTGGATSLHKGEGTHASTKAIEDIVYQRGFPGFDVFAINISDNLLHVWRRARNGSNGSAVETEADEKVNAVSAVYARSFDKVFVTAIKKEGSSHPILFKALTGHHEAVDGWNKMSAVPWQEIPGQFVLLDMVDTPHGVVGIAYDVVEGLKFLVCDLTTHCSVVGVAP